MSPSHSVREKKSEGTVPALTRRGLGLGGIISIGMFAVFLCFALWPGLFATHDPLEQNLPERLDMPSSAHFFGTDELGRDIYSRLVHGTGLSLGTSMIAVVVSLISGVPLGLITGYLGGTVDEILSRAADVLLSFPPILVAMTILAISGQNSTVVAIAIGIVYIPPFVRITRAMTLTLKVQPYVDAVRSAGASSTYIMMFTILPNCLGAILVQVLLVASRAVILETGLSFLGLGTPPPTPTWGNMLSMSRNFVYQLPWYGVFPGLFIVALVLSLQLLSAAGRRKWNV